MPCIFEKADERLFLHALHAAKTCKPLLVKTVDSDVVVIALSVFHRIPNLTELWIEYGVGKAMEFIPIHEISDSLGPLVSEAHFFFHAISGCDTTSSFAGKAKISFYFTWKLLPELTPFFVKLSCNLQPE